MYPWSVELYPSPLSETISTPSTNTFWPTTNGYVEVVNPKVGVCRVSVTILVEVSKSALITSIPFVLLILTADMLVSDNPDPPLIIETSETDEIQIPH